MENLFKFMNLELPLLVAGLFGGIATLYNAPKVTIKVFLIAVSGGALLAGYLTPFVSDVLNLSDNIESGLAFLIGVFGMNIIGGIFTISQRFKKDPIDTVKSIKKVKDNAE